MPFNSYPYLGCLALAVLVYWQLPHRLRGFYLLLVSVLYYGTWNPNHIVIPLSLCLLVWLISRPMTAPQANPRRWMWLGIGLVLLVLGFFKYRHFFLQASGSVLAPLDLQPVALAAGVGLPLGISFYSFEAISYLIDSRQRRIARPPLLQLCNFVMFWPHLMAGPIVRVRELVPQLLEARTFRPGFLIAGLDRILWGLVQKNAIANPIGRWVEEGLQPERLPTTADAWFLAIGFGFQIYFDFAGYSNMAIGAARMLGIEFPQNFRFPFHASAPPDFWARWHMTLSRWVRDYLFFPINARFQGAPLPLYLSLLGIMALVGLWHGAGWGFVLWGMAHGAAMVLFRIYESLASEGIRSSLAARVGWRVFTLLVVTVAWVPFRAENLSQAAELLQTMFFGLVPGLALPSRFYQATVLVAVFCGFEPLLVRFLEWLESGAAQQDRRRSVALVLVRCVTYACAVLLFMIFDEQETEFIYFRF